MTRIKTKIISVLAALLILSALITVGAAHSITNITLDPPSPACLAFGERVNVTFNYSTNETESIWIHVYPFTGGSETQHYEGGAGLIWDGSGNGSGWGDFTITGGEVKVDQLQFTMYNYNGSTQLLEFFIPVQYCFGECACIEIEKRINGEDYVTALPDDTLEITLLINNCGCVNLTNISVHDQFPIKQFNAGLSYADNANPVDDGWVSSVSPEGWIDVDVYWRGNVPPFLQGHLAPFEPLQPGENFTITFEATVDELAEGPYENCATVSANYTIPGAIRGTVNATDCATVFVPSPVPILTPTGLSALISALSAIAAVAIVRKRR